MAMSVLIDGYNLLYALGWMSGARAGRAALEKARLRLVGFLSGAYGPRAADVTLVFDAANAPPGMVDDAIQQGVHVRFAVRHDQADDLIEELIDLDSAPRQLTVVSDDHRVQQAAERRQCVVLGCLDYMEGLLRQRREREQPPRKPAKPETLTAAEMEHWLSEFDGLGQDPDFKELFNPWDFDEEKS
jgi:predicted RNA-binding protein with PIN domain